MRKRSSGRGNPAWSTFHFLFIHCKLEETAAALFMGPKKGPPSWHKKKLKSSRGWCGWLDSRRRRRRRFLCKIDIFHYTLCFLPPESIDGNRQTILMTAGSWSVWLKFM